MDGAGYGPATSQPNVKEVKMLGVSMVALSPELALVLELVKQRKDFAHLPLCVQGSCGNNGMVRAPF